MGAEQKRSKEAPVRASEVLSGVLAALAVEQIAQGALAAFYATPSGASDARHLLPAILALLLILTAVRFFHGNAVYLESRYSRWSHTEVQPNAWLVTPFRHAIDVVVHILEYTALVAAGYLLEKDLTFSRSMWAVAILMGIAALWVGVMLLKPVDEAGAVERRTLRTWLITNAGSSALLIFFLLKWPNEWWLPWSLAFVLITNTIIDYTANYAHYFDPRMPTSSVGIPQAATAVAYLASLVGVPQQFAGTPLDRTSLKNLFESLFSFFMLSQDNRAKLFHRSTALLHVGLYLYDGGLLKPVIRYRVQGIELKNREFRVGEDYIGSAFLELKDDPYGAQFNPRRDPRWESGKKDPSKKFYKSSILVNVFWPPSEPKEAIGTLLITSNQEEYFTKSVHETLLIGLSSLLSFSLEQMAGKIAAQQLTAQIAEKCSKPLELKASQGESDDGRAQASEKGSGDDLRSDS